MLNYARAPNCADVLPTRPAIATLKPAVQHAESQPQPLPPGGISSSMRALVHTEKPSFPHPNFSDAVNRNVVQSEIEGGFNLYDVPPGAVFEVQTKNHIYTIVHKALGQVLISGHPEFCPSPVEVRIHGSTWGGSMIKNHYLGRGMHLEFAHPVHQVVITSQILHIHAAA